MVNYYGLRRVGYVPAFEEICVEQANEIMQKFLRQQRVRAGFSIADVALCTKQPAEQIQDWEDRPIEAPLNQIAQMINIYKTAHNEINEIIWEATRAIRSTPNRST